MMKNDFNKFQRFFKYVRHHFNFIQNKNLGLDKEQVVYLRALSEGHEAFRDELLAQNGILSVGFTDQHPAQVTTSTNEMSWVGSNPQERVLFHVQSVDPGYIPTMGIEVIEGRNFIKQKSDSSTVIINESALKIMGYDDPIGNTITWSGVDLTIIGVTKDFHFKSIHQSIEPLILGYDPGGLSRTLVKIDRQNVKESVLKIKNQWEKLNPSREFNYSFLDDEFNSLYQSEELTAKLFTYFSTLAIIISCLGLFGLSSFMVEQRTKEISVRKVIGASIGNLYFLVSKEFTKLVLISFFISIPMSLYLMSNWLESFAYRIELGISVFVLSGILALFIALATISYQSLSAAMTNPIKNLRSE